MKKDKKFCLSMACNSSILHDDEILAKLRKLVRQYLELKVSHQLTQTQSDQIKKSFSEFHHQLQDTILKEYTQFAFLENLMSPKFKKLI